MPLQSFLTRAWCAGALLATLAPQTASAQRGPSLHVQCDGHPDNVSDGETAARILGAVTLLGLFAPAPESSDESSRLYGAEGVRVCTDLLTRERHDVRRAQLRLANAIHHIEARDFEAAIAQSRQVATERPATAQAVGFRMSLALSALELEAHALLGLGRLREASDKAMEMAAAAPYDIVSYLRAAPFVRLTGEYGPAEQRFYANLVRLYPAGLVERSNVRQMAGDFRGAAEDLELWNGLTEPMLERPNTAILAQAALTRAIAGDMAAAEALAERARAALRDDPDYQFAQLAGEMLDLHQVLVTARRGEVGQARILFAGRTAWIRPSPAAVGFVAAELRQGAAEADLTGLLAGNPTRFRTERLGTYAENLRAQAGEPESNDSASPGSADGDATKVESPASQLFDVVRPHWTDRSLAAFSGNTWRVQRSRYFDPDDNPDMRARRLMSHRDGYGMPAYYALLLHTALMAEAEGRSSFMIVPSEPSLTEMTVRIGEPSADLPAALAFNVQQVINDLSPLIPRPAPRSR
jgi:tetratricopeptide (TPR) repeat protein